MTNPTAQDIAALRSEWITGGRLVVGDDPSPSDHEAVYRWVLDFMDGGADDPDYGTVLGLIYHSLNFDIPFSATKSVRDDLMHMARRKLEDPQWRRQTI
ncbi:hypothetical protein [Methylobacterium sp. 88A]|uniref:hypothetical protein n=1 Tax=Methylobacterium sp. 88A TaxID=1131813 RepID=UPI000370EE68|nr:hypothetical protein [Methylobacterium sp. 88A]